MSDDEKWVKQSLMRGESVASICADMAMKRSEVEAIRTSLLAELSSTDGLKAAARGPIINAGFLNKPNLKVARRARSSATQQEEMFPTQNLGVRRGN